jgi:hypothetical protein
MPWGTVRRSASPHPLDAELHLLLACIRCRAKDDNFSAAQLLDALLEISAVEEGLVFEAAPYVFKQVSVEAVGAYRAEDMADLVHAGDVEKESRRSLPRRQKPGCCPGSDRFLAEA